MCVIKYAIIALPVCLPMSNHISEGFNLLVLMSSEVTTVTTSPIFGGTVVSLLGNESGKQVSKLGFEYTGVHLPCLAVLPGNVV